MKKLLLIILALALSTGAYAQCSGISATGTTKAKVTKVCYDTVVVASSLNTVTADTVSCTKLTVTNLTDGILKSVSDVLTPAVSNTDYAPVVSPVFTTPSLGVASGTSLALTGGITGRKFYVNDKIVVPSTATSALDFYNTVDTTTNYERLKIYKLTNVFTIESGIGGSGTIRNLQIGTTNRKLIFVDGTPGIPGLYQFTAGTSGANNSLLNTTGTLSASSGINSIYSATNTINQSGTAGYRCNWISIYEQSNGSGVKSLADWGTNTSGVGAGTHTSKFLVDNSGNETIQGNMTLATVGNGLYIKTGTNATFGSAALTAGTVTVSTTKVTANSVIFLTRQNTGGTIGTSLDVTARTAGTSFTITANGSILDTSTVGWVIIEPAP